MIPEEELKEATKEVIAGRNKEDLGRMLIELRVIYNTKDRDLTSTRQKMITATRNLEDMVENLTVLKGMADPTSKAFINLMIQVYEQGIRIQELEKSR
jgi:hypothetical protein